MRRLRALVVLAVVVSCLPACSGPRQPIEVAVKEFPGDVAIGKKTTLPPKATIPSGVNPQPVGFPSFLQPPPPLQTVGGSITDTGATTTTRPAPPVTCGVANPLAAPKREATKNVSAPPSTQQLTYRNTGTYEVVARDGKTRQGTYPPTSTRSIASQSKGDGTYYYFVQEQAAGGATTTSYFLDPARGLYLRGVVSSGPTGVDQFQTDRDDAILLLRLPVAQGDPIGGIGLDVRSATSMSVTGTVVGKARVDACGTPIDTWQVQITEGRITGPDKQVRFTATYDIGTQYGALSLRDVVEFRCDEQVNTYCDNGQKIVTKNTAVVSSEPKVAGT